MLKLLLELSKQIIGFTTDTQKNKEDVKALLTDSAVKEDTIKQIIFELQRLKEKETLERENLLLRMQLALKDTEQRFLPPGASTTQAEEIAELRARVAALETQVAEQKALIEELKNRD